MTKHEMTWVASFLDELTDRYSTDGCNDMSMPDTPENRELLLAARKDADYDEPLCPRNGKLMTGNSIVCRYLLHKIMFESGILKSELEQTR